MGDNQQLGKLEGRLKQPDAILEPHILEALRRYVMRGGKPQTVVEALSESYAGYAQMATLVCSWLAMTDEEEGDRTTEEDGNEMREGQTEFSFLQNMVKERFDVDKFAGVFTKGGSGPPSWLDGLAADSQGRKLIYELSGEHKNCLLLNFAIQTILYQGHENEVANVGSSLSGYFGVFHRLMVTRLRCVKGLSQSNFQAEIASIANSCSQDLHSYAHMQMVATELGRHQHGGSFRRLSQELEKLAAEQHGELVWRMNEAFAGFSVSEAHQHAAALVGELLQVGEDSIASSRGQDIIRQLHALYTCSDPPPTEPLRHPRCFESLLAALFNPDHNLPHKTATVYMHILVCHSRIAVITG
mmetsp:Transcript_35814/g.91489  ORF Transcript_35814/g.91489 Transcript_35814/m.91489 type:complete len:357 (+) Transcript_35814:434-1504(+)